MPAVNSDNIVCPKCGETPEHFDIENLKEENMGFYDYRLRMKCGLCNVPILFLQHIDNDAMGAITKHRRLNQ